MATHMNVGGHEAHVVDRLAEYFSGSLADAEELVVEAHLVSCAACRIEYDELGVAAVALALQPPHQLDAQPLSGAGHRPASPDGQPSRGSPGPGRGRSGNPGRRPTRSPRLRRLAGYAAVLVLGATFGVGGTLLADRNSTPPLVNVDDTQDISTDRLTVTLTEADEGGTTRVQAAAVGLRRGRGFQLVAVDIRGQGYLVTSGVADGGVQSIAGSVPAAPSEIILVVLVEDDHGALLVARPS